VWRQTGHTVWEDVGLDAMSKNNGRNGLQQSSDGLRYKCKLYMFQVPYNQLHNKP